VKTLLLILLVTLVGCGQKGPLYMPKDETARINLESPQISKVTPYLARHS